MSPLISRIRERISSIYVNLKQVFINDEGAIDLASIMVGVIVIGTIGGVTAATVFAVIPWTQDNAAKQQLDSVEAAQNAYFGLSADPQSANLPAGTKPNGYASSAELQAAKLLASSDRYCTSVSRDRQSYEAYSKSDSGEIFLSTDKDTSPVPYSGSLPSDCMFLLPAYTDPNPTTTTLTYKCDVTTTGALPLSNTLVGKETWNDGVTQTYSGAANTVSRTLNAGVTYKMTFEGTYRQMNSASTAETVKLSPCLVSVDHWGLNTGVVDASHAFRDAKNLVSVPAYLPPTVTNTSSMFALATKINDSNISKWNVSNVTNMMYMFSDSTYNQPLNHWDVGNVTNMTDMFSRNPVFNQPLNNWDVSNVASMRAIFFIAPAFNQPLDNWDVSNVTNMYYMFHGASSFNQPIGNWNVGNVTTMHFMFTGAKAFNQPIGNWNVSKVTNMEDMFSRATVFNQPLDNWNVSNVNNMAGMFANAQAFNQPIGNWNVSKVTYMPNMFYNALMFNQPVGNWNVSNVTSMAGMFRLSAFNQPLENWNVGNVNDMNFMFSDAKAFNQPLNSWNVSNVTNIQDMFSRADKFNQPLNNWNVSKVTNMRAVFYDAFAFNQPLDTWNTSAVNNMDHMFQGTAVFNQNISMWSLAGNPTNVAFRIASALTAANSPFGV